MLGFTNKSNKNNNPMAGTGVDPKAVTYTTYISKATLRAASKKKRPKDKPYKSKKPTQKPTLRAASEKKRPPKKLTEKKTTKKSRELSKNKDIKVETKFTLNPPKGTFGILPTTYNVTIQMKGHARVISQNKQTVKATEPKGDSYAKYKYHINKLLLKHIDLTIKGIDDTILVANDMNLPKTEKEAAIKLLKKIKKATKPKINADIETWLEKLGVKVILTGTKKSKTATGEVITSYYSKMTNLTDIPGVKDYISSKDMEKLRKNFKIQDDMSAEEYLGETLFLGLKF